MEWVAALELGPADHDVVGKDLEAPDSVCHYNPRAHAYRATHALHSQIW